MQNKFSLHSLAFVQPQPELVEGGRVGGRCSFRGLGMGETAALSHSTLLMALSTIEGPVEGNAEGARIPRKQVAEKTSP